jgi:serine/threonine protein kinase
MAPEIFEAGSRHGFEVDIWAIGVIIYKLLFGKAPFSADKGLDQLYENARRCRVSFPVQPSVSHSAKDLIMKCLTVDACTFSSFLF